VSASLSIGVNNRIQSSLTFFSLKANKYKCYGEFTLSFSLLDNTDDEELDLSSQRGAASMTSQQGASSSKPPQRHGRLMANIDFHGKNRLSPSSSKNEDLSLLALAKDLPTLQKVSSMVIN